ncbi:MAG: hypothetical protein Q4D07_08210 [Selenomonadaceae bacterium]|nr:hypothetical protein [Selenomonadaceae bacterium]
MNGFVRIIALLPGLVLTAELLSRAGADWFGAYMAGVLTVCLSVLLTDRAVIAPEAALTAELVFSSVYIMGLGHGAARVILLLGALLVLPVGSLLTRCTERLRMIISSAAILGLALMLLSMGFGQSGLVRPAVMTHSQLGNLLAPDVLVTLLTLLVMGLLRAGSRTKGYTFAGGLIFALLLAVGEGFLDLDEGIFALPSAEYIGKVWFAFDIPAAWEVCLTAPGDVLLPAVTIAITMVTLTGAVCRAAEMLTREDREDASADDGLNRRSSLLGAVSACLGSGPVTLSPLSLLGRDGKADDSRYGMLAAAVLLLFSAPLARSVAECPGIIAPFYLWLGGRLTIGSLMRLTETLGPRENAGPEGAVTAASAVLAALSCNLTAGIGAALVSYTVLQLLKGQGRSITGAEWLITGCYLLYFSSYCF